MVIFRSILEPSLFGLESLRHRFTDQPRLRRIEYLSRNNERMHLHHRQFRPRPRTQPLLTLVR